MLQRLARALLYCEPSREEHIAVLGASFATPPPRDQIEQIAARSLQWVSVWPLPRMHRLAFQLGDDDIVRAVLLKHALQAPVLGPAARQRTLPGLETLPKLETLQSLADWLRLDAEHLEWFADLKDRNRNTSQSGLRQYTSRVIVKPHGSVRVLEAPKPRLKALQRQILAEILTPVPLHAAVHGFRKCRSIVSFAEPHGGHAVVLRMDLQDFFVSISGPRVQALFRALGYPEPVADALGGLCTTTTPKGVWKHAGQALDREELRRLQELYRRPHLPQGAPSSPAIANLCAYRLDRRVAGLAKAGGAVYTRYADDLALSGGWELGRAAGRMEARLAAIAAEEGFAVNYRKTRVMGSSGRQALAGLVVNATPNVKRTEFDHLKAILTNCVRRGPASQNRENRPDLRRYLEGRVAFVSMVNPGRAERLRGLLASIDWTA